MGAAGGVMGAPRTDVGPNDHDAGLFLEDGDDCAHRAGTGRREAEVVFIEGADKDKATGPGMTTTD